jgi:hypothetical protein
MAEGDDVLYHLAHGRLAPGTVIQPGGHGEKIRQGLLPPVKLERERVLEVVRVSQFPEKPSRQMACFAFANIDTARMYQQVYFKHGILHEVRGYAVLVHRGNFLALQPIARRPEGPEEMAARYCRRVPRRPVR